MPFANLVRDSVGGLNGFDYFVLAGAAVNLAVIVILVGYWLVAG